MGLMADSINELLDENEKAAGVLQQEVEQTDELLLHIIRDFHEKLKLEIFGGSAKHILEAFEVLSTNYDTAEHEFTELGEHISTPLSSVGTLANEFGEKIEAIEKSFQEMAEHLK